jgi:hypothetical protein
MGCSAAAFETGIIISILGLTLLITGYLNLRTINKLSKREKFDDRLTVSKKLKSTETSKQMFAPLKYV